MQLEDAVGLSLVFTAMASCVGDASNPADAGADGPDEPIARWVHHPLDE